MFTHLLRLADTHLILGHRLSEWSGHAPVLEEDIALSNIALDLLGQARMLYTYAGETEGKGRDEDALCYLRDTGDYKNLLLAEQPNGDFAFTILRQFFFSHWAFGYYSQKFDDKVLQSIADKAVKEFAYHVRHTSEWVIRLGDGTELSRAKMLDALDETWAYTGEMFDIGGDKAAWLKAITPILREATLHVPTGTWFQTGGLSGNHSEHLGHILAELQHLQRAYPGATW
jgi:ring-1,2-phenylacetyl-CoA epoxidase subunit PaaC